MILYVGPIWSGSSAAFRLEGLQRLGLDIQVLDTSGWAVNGNRWLDSWVQRTFCGPSVWKMNHTLLEHVRKCRPEVVWMDKGIWVYPWVLRKVRGICGNLVHYNTDDVYFKGGHFWMHRRTLSPADVYLTTNRLNVVEIPNQFAVRAWRAGMGYDPHIHRVSPSTEKDWDLIFVGHWEPRTEKNMCVLRDAGVSIQVWGPNWRHAANPALRKVQPLAYGQYLKFLPRAKAALCVLSHNNRNESTIRSFEIPAAGVCMIAERTAEHAYLYKDGREALLFSTAEELVSQATRCRSNEALRESIAKAGRERVIQLAMDWPAHMRREWPQIQAIMRGEPVDRLDVDHPYWPGFRRGMPCNV